MINFSCQMTQLFLKNFYIDLECICLLSDLLIVLLKGRISEIPVLGKTSHLGSYRFRNQLSKLTLGKARLIIVEVWLLYCSRG